MKKAALYTMHQFEYFIKYSPYEICLAMVEKLKKIKEFRCDCGIVQLSRKNFLCPLTNRWTMAAHSHAYCPIGDIFFVLAVVGPFLCFNTPVAYISNEGIRLRRATLSIAETQTTQWHAPIFVYILIYVSWR